MVNRENNKTWIFNRPVYKPARYLLQPLFSRQKIFCTHFACAHSNGYTYHGHNFFLIFNIQNALIMSILALIRQKTGISQYQLAEYLDVSRSTINMVEQGLRNLPREASMRADALLITITENEKAANNNKKPAANDEAKTRKLSELAQEHNYKMQQCKHKAKRLQSKLDKIKKQTLQVTTRQEMLNTLKEHFPDAKKKEVDETWTAYQHVIIRNHLTNTVAEEDRLQAEIDMQLGYAAVHETILKKYWPDQFAK